jgi:hypothetical protein
MLVSVDQDIWRLSKRVTLLPLQSPLDYLIVWLASTSSLLGTSAISIRSEFDAFGWEHHDDFTNRSAFTAHRK